MNKTYFTQLTGYIIWVNNKVIHWLEQISDEQWEQPIASSFDSIAKTTLHIVSAEKIWVDFWENNLDAAFLSTQFKGPKNELLAIWRETSVALKSYIENYPEDDYSQPISIKLRGEVHQLEFWQTFAHFVNHATYHRGQLVTMLRQAGFTGFSSADLFNYFLAN